jgi:alpha-ketoglutarate-dependent taurine dioxygenase
MQDVWRVGDALVVREQTLLIMLRRNLSSIYYHNFGVGDVVVLDECATIHKNAGDYNPADRRVFMRTIVF